MAGQAHADSVADGGTAGSPGVISGNALQLPIHLPVNVCGNTINVVGLLNPAAGNTCENVSGGGAPGGATGGAVAQGAATDSPGVISGNGVQLPVDLPVNVSGNSVSVVGVLNPALGNVSANRPAEPVAPRPPVRPAPVTPPKVVPPKQPSVPQQPQTPQKPEKPVEAPAASKPTEVLASTGAGPVGYAAAAGAAMLLGGAVLVRRVRRSEG